MNQDMHEKIIDVATDLFMKQGYRVTSTRQIAKILNITQPAIYHHFHNKEMLYLAVLRNFAHQIGRALNIQRLTNSNDHDKLYEMTLQLKENHSVNLALMMHDMNNELSENAKYEVYQIWKTNYIEPLEMYFDDIVSRYGLKIDHKTVARLYMKGLAAFINDDLQDYYLPNKEIELFVSIFLKGLLQHT